MNRLSVAERAAILAMLVEGNSLRSITRLTGVSINTVTKLLVDLGTACAKYHDECVRDVTVRRLQCDAIWCFVGPKAKHVRPGRKAEGCGDVWTWTAIDADTKLCVSYLVGGRDAGWAGYFMEDCASRVNSRVQLSTDANRTYLEAVEGAFGMDVDYAQLQKIYGASSDADIHRYSPARSPSKRVANHAHTVAIHFMHYNFARVHKTLRVTPAMESGLSGPVWSLEEIVLLAN